MATKILRIGLLFVWLTAYGQQVSPPPSAGATGAPFSQTVTSVSSIAITHNLGTSQPWVICYDGSGNILGGATASTSITNVVATSANVATVTFSGTTTGVCLVSTGSVGPTGASGTNGTNGTGYYATSTTSQAIGGGSLTFTTQANLAYVTASPIFITSAASPSTNNMYGTVTSYSGTSLVVNVTSTNGSGTHTDWVFSATGVPGATGATGPVSFSTNAQTSTYQATTADFASFKSIPIASGTFTVTLVASTSQPSAGQGIVIVNYGSGVVTVAASGQNINGASTSLKVYPGTQQNPQILFVMSDGTNYYTGETGHGCTTPYGFLSNNLGITSAGGASQFPSSSVVAVEEVLVTCALTINKWVVDVVTQQSGVYGAFGIYSIAGNLLCSIKGINANISPAAVVTAPNDVTTGCSIPPGYYYWGWAANSNLAAFNGSTTTSSTVMGMFNAAGAATVFFGTAANAASGSTTNFALPSTLGTVTANNTNATAIASFVVLQ